MPYLSTFAAVAALAGLAAAQSSTAAAATGSVTQVLLPIADPQPLDASLIGTGPNGVKTLAIACAPGTPSDQCGFPQPITITAGPSTLHIQPTGIYQVIAEIDCKITGTTQAFCLATAGVYDTASLQTATDTNWLTSPASTSTTTSVTLTGSDLSFISVTITAGATGGDSTGSSSAGKTTSTSHGGSSTRSGSGSSSTGSSTASSSSATATSNSAAALSGLSASGVVAGLLALPMLLL